MRLIGFFLFMMGLGALAAGTQPPAELHFPVEKSNVQALPQRFEYNLLSKDEIQIGNLLINSNAVEFQLIPLQVKSNRYRLRFQWPASLLKEGEIAIKDNSGKGIWFHKFDAGQLQLSSDQKTVTYETETEVSALLKLVQFYPFFKFCVHRIEPLTQIYLCSKDLYLRKKKENAQIWIESRDTPRPQSFVEINGKAVGDQGAIYLNSPSETVFMRALLLSGATVELGTRMKDVNFKDVYVTDDGTELVVRAQGTEPVDQATARKIPGTRDEWEARLSVERPFTYLKGEGELPLRQEFLIKGPVRRNDIRVSVLSDPSHLTFVDEYVLDLKPAPGLKLAPYDSLSSLEPLENDESTWTLSQLKNNEINRRYLKVISPQGEFVAAYDIERAPALDGSLQFLLPFGARADLVYTPSLKWGVGFQFEKGFDRPSSEAGSQILTGRLQYRLAPSRHLQDPHHAVEFLVQSLKTDGAQLVANSLGYSGTWKAPEQMSNYFQWMTAQFRYPFAISDANFQLKTSYELEVSLRSMTEPLSYWEVGLRSLNYRFETLGSTIDLKKNHLFIGKGWVF